MHIRCWFAAIAALCLIRASAGTQVVPPACGLSDPDARWIQTALDGWRKVSHEFLGAEHPPLPWIVLFNNSCVWNVAPEDGTLDEAAPITTPLSFGGQPIPIRAVARRETVHLPDGRDIPAQPVAMASVYRAGEAAFFVMALPDIWRRDARYTRDPDLDKFLLGVMIHEMVHTRHLPRIIEQAKELAAPHKLADLVVDDDIVQKRFASVRGFTKAFEAERDIFFPGGQQSRPAETATVDGRGASDGAPAPSAVPHW